MFLSLLYQIHFPLAKYLTSAVGRCLFPIAIYGEGVADRLGGKVKYLKKLNYQKKLL